jgi:hypothetical protein
MFQVMRKLLWNMSIWSAIRLNWRNSTGVSFGSGFCSVTPALRGIYPVTGLDVAVAGIGSVESDDAILVGDGGYLEAKPVLGNCLGVEVDKAGKLSGVGNDRPCTILFRAREYDMRFTQVGLEVFAVGSATMHRG